MSFCLSRGNPGTNKKLPASGGALSGRRPWLFLENRRPTILQKIEPVLSSFEGACPESREARDPTGCPWNPCNPCLITLVSLRK